MKDVVTEISVIIPTVNAVEELDLAIRSIKHNSDYKIDLVVIIDPDMGTGKINQDIVRVCKAHSAKPHLNKSNLGPYGSWNRGAEVARTDYLVFATDDQYFAPHWDRNLVREWQPKRLVVGRLVEPGIIPVYKLNIRKDFGVIPSEFREDKFNAWCAARTDEGFSQDGFFIPMLQHRDDYDALGHYPTEGKFGTSTAISNDVAYVTEARNKGYEFGTANDSYSYHFQASSWKKKTLEPTIAAIVLTKDEEADLPPCLSSLSWATDIIVVDSGSTDKTLEIAKKYKTKIHKRKFDNFAAQRNFALTKAASYDWALMVDADEIIEKKLAKELMSFALDIYLDGVEIPRKNKIFGRWIEHADWYPDYRLVFTRPKIVTYKGDVHERVEFTRGNKTVARAQHHLLHHNYDTVREFVTKNLVDYPEQYARVLDSEGHKFVASDLLVKPVGEFMRRFFLSEGYKDGLFGLILSLLMGAQSLVSYAYLWEMQGKRRDLTTEETQGIFRELRGKGVELTYWLTTMAVENSKGAKKYLHRARRKALKLAKGI